MQFRLNNLLHSSALRRQRARRRAFLGEQGNVESFLVLVPLTLLFLGVLTLLLFLQIRIAALGVAMTFAREVSLTSATQESERIAREKLREVGLREPIVIQVERRDLAGLEAALVHISGHTVMGVSINLEVTSVKEE
jgi:cobalamin biosynthesis protein CobD/CbiB